MLYWTSMDDRLRKLERLTKQGDLEAMGELSIERIRSGLPIIPSFMRALEERALEDPSQPYASVDLFTAYFVFPTRIVTVCVPHNFGELVIWMGLIEISPGILRAASIDKVVWIDVLDSARRSLLSEDLREGWETSRFKTRCFGSFLSIR